MGLKHNTITQKVNVVVLSPVGPLACTPATLECQPLEMVAGASHGSKHCSLAALHCIKRNGLTNTAPNLIIGS